MSEIIPESIENRFIIAPVTRQKEEKHLSDDQGRRAYILRISREEAERQLYLRRWLYVGLKRDWSNGSKILLLRKTDSFFGSGVIEKVIGVDQLEEPEREQCLLNNWYTKVYFVRLAKFLPPLPLRDTKARSYNPLTLHGSELSEADFLAIEAMARCKIII